MMQWFVVTRAAGSLARSSPLAIATLWQRCTLDFGARGARNGMCKVFDYRQQI